MEDKRYNRNNLPFKESQIICLEYDNTCLYGEVIQLIPERDMCWFRPICMITTNSSGDRDLENCEIVQLQSSSDLLWPVALFRPALDTEVISLLSDFDNTNKFGQDKASPRQHLNRFVRQVWAANQDKF